MTNSKTVLLASFINKNELDESLKKIKKNFVIAGSKVFVLRDKQDQNKLVLTYNISLTDDAKIQFDNPIPGTVSLHRKKDSNTLYTLNALNEVVRLENGGNLDPKFIVNWLKYRNCILITQKQKGLVKIETELEKIEDLQNIN